ncbi:MAG: dihydropteroate synthase [Flavobacteriales bacterium]|nr:dihydropteroate synthase [Flavobacteriales bacterium]
MPHWRLKDRLYEAHFPMVMGILNSTPDSFHAPSRTQADDALRMAERMLNEGASILDIGGASSRPGAEEINEAVELERVLPVIEMIHTRFPDVLLSIDTYRSRVAGDSVAAGACMVNDISAGTFDTEMLPTVAKLGVPYIAMHMQGTPRNMQAHPQYTNVVSEVTRYLSERLNAAHTAGIADVTLDPGFGFGKTTAHNYALLRSLSHVSALGAPVLVGLSRKRMINEVLGTTPEEALNGTTALNTIALLNGASILRVHDVREAVECVKLVTALRG